MARQRPRTPPSFAFEDNPSSKFGIIYADLLKSQRFRELSGSAKVLYVCMSAHAHTRESLECLYNTISELDRVMKLNSSPEQIREAVYQRDYQYFVFPARHYQGYGFDRKTFWKLKEELLRAGFIEEIVKQSHLRRVTVFGFSANWKRKHWEYKKPAGDFVNSFWVKDFPGRL